jgi:hypothetical protein
LIGNGSSLSLPQRSNSGCLIFRREITMSVQLETETVRNRNALAGVAQPGRTEPAIEMPQGAGRPHILARRHRRWERRAAR